MNVLLTGASGTVGSEVLKQLAAMKNIRLTVFDKQSGRTKKIFATYKNNVEIIYGDLCNEEDISNIPLNLDAVIHLAAIIPPLADEKPDLTHKVNVLGTKALIERLEATSPNVFLLYSSSISVYGDRLKSPFINVDDPLNPSENDIYAESKIEAEKLIRNSHLTWSIFRLAAIMKNHKISKLMFHMPLSTKLEICTPTDTAKAFTEAVFKRNQLNQKIFNLGGGESCCTTYEDFLERSFGIFGLGALNFPKLAFANRNFHCGFYEDGYLLDEILHFRNDTLETYFEQQKKTIPLAIKILAFTFRSFLKKFLLIQSEPYNSIRKNNKSLMQLFFGKTDISFRKISNHQRAKKIEPAI
jgi:nucleoside-diphosphate-sugar epimerase